MSRYSTTADYRDLTTETILAAQAGDQRALTTVVEAFDRAFYSYARKITENSHFGGETQDDLIQEGRLALMEALPDFDPSQGSLQTFVYQRATGAMKHALSGETLGPSVPHSTATKYLSAIQETGSILEASDLARENGFSVFSDVHSVLSGTASMDYSEDDYSEDGDGEGLQIAAPDSTDDQAVNIVMVEALLDLVENPRQRMILEMWAGLGGYSPPLTEADIAKALGISQPSVHRARKRALATIKKGMKK